MNVLRFRKAIVYMICLSLAMAAATSNADEMTSAGVTFLKGTARVFSKEHPRGTALRKGDRISMGQEVKVGERSKMEIRFPEGTVMRFAENAIVNIDEVRYRAKGGEKNFSVALTLGRIWAKVRQLATKDSLVEVRTANAVAGVRGTVYRVNAEEDKSALVKVYDGMVAVTGIPHRLSGRLPASPPVEVPGPHAVPPPYHEVTMEEWHVIVKSFQQVAISPEGKPSKPTDFNQSDDLDDWVRWNQERDRNVDF